jgi:hypothetical protein
VSGIIRSCEIHGNVKNAQDGENEAGYQNNTAVTRFAHEPREGDKQKQLGTKKPKPFSPWIKSDQRIQIRIRWSFFIISWGMFLVTPP